LKSRHYSWSGGKKILLIPQGAGKQGGKTELGGRRFSELRGEKQTGGTAREKKETAGGGTKNIGCISTKNRTVYY